MQVLYRLLSIVCFSQSSSMLTLVMSLHLLDSTVQMDACWPLLCVLLEALIQFSFAFFFVLPVLVWVKVDVTRHLLCVVNGLLAQLVHFLLEGGRVQSPVGCVSYRVITCERVFQYAFAADADVFRQMQGLIGKKLIMRQNLCWCDWVEVGVWVVWFFSLHFDYNRVCWSLFLADSEFVFRLTFRREHLWWTLVRIGRKLFLGLHASS